MPASDPSDTLRSNSEQVCSRPISARARDGISLFNRGEYFEAHEALEDAWRAETGKVRDLYRGVLQVAVVYLHITRGNYPGAVKVYERSKRWLKDWPAVCRGIKVEQLRRDAENVMAELKKLGRENINQFDKFLLKPVEMDESKTRHIYTCDRCGHEMSEKNCKITCPNCGNRFDCSDLNIYFD